MPDREQAHRHVDELLPPRAGKGRMGASETRHQKSKIKDQIKRQIAAPASLSVRFTRRKSNQLPVTPHGFYYSTSLRTEWLTSDP